MICRRVSTSLTLSGVVFSVARSKLAFPTQFLFLAINGLGVLFGTIYNVHTPDLYENNAHHSVGWVATWVMTAQVAMSLIFTYSGRGTKGATSSSERAAFLPLSTSPIPQNAMSPYHDYRWSGDSGHGTERSSLYQSRDASPTGPERRVSSESRSKLEPEPDDNGEDDHNEKISPRHGFLRDTFVDRYLSKRIPHLFSERLLQCIAIASMVIDATILPLGFIAFATGGVTWAGLMVSVVRRSLR